MALAAIVAALIWRGKNPHPATYKMSDEWTHAPILWASDEPADRYRVIVAVGPRVGETGATY